MEDKETVTLLPGQTIIGTKYTKNNYVERLEQENATYKANADAVHKYITQNEQLKTHIDGLEKKNAELKAENERLKEENFNFEEIVKLCKCEQYHQTLQEIKAISEKFIKNVSEDCINITPMFLIHKEIIQKINKAEEE